MSNKTPTPHPKYSAVCALAQKYGVSEATIWRWAKAGRIPAPLKLGPNTTRWDVEAVEAALARAAEGGE